MLISTGLSLSEGLRSPTSACPRSLTHNGEVMKIRGAHEHAATPQGRAASRMSHIRRTRTILGACLISAAACSSDTATPTAPTTPTTFTEVFSGTITQNGAASHFFVSQASGTARAILSSLSPDATQLVGLSLGTWTGTACQVVIANDKATTSSAVAGAVGQAGSLCARVYDVGSISRDAPVTYELLVEHP
jgi:hypothetical protein